MIIDKFNTNVNHFCLQILKSRGIFWSGVEYGEIFTTLLFFSDYKSDRHIVENLKNTSFKKKNHLRCHH